MYVELTENNFETNNFFVDVEKEPEADAAQSEDEENCHDTIEVEAINTDEATSSSQTSHIIEGLNTESCLSTGTFQCLVFYHKDCNHVVVLDYNFCLLNFYFALHFIHVTSSKRKFRTFDQI